MKKICDRPDINDCLLLYLDNSLPDGDKKAAHDHLQECRVCRQELEELKSAADTLASHAALRAAQRAGTKGCILPEHLVAYAAQPLELAAEEREKAAQHLGRCPACRLLYDQLRELEGDLQQGRAFREAPSTEQFFLETVSRHFPLKKKVHRSLSSRVGAVLSDVLDRCRQWCFELFAIRPEAQPVFVRKARRSLQENITVINERSRGVETRIEIEEQEGNTVELIVFLKAHRTKRPVKNLRVSLYHRGAETVSLFADTGKAVFRCIPHGTYEIALFKNGTAIKRIHFTTK